MFHEPRLLAPGVHPRAPCRPLRALHPQVGNTFAKLQGLTDGHAASTSRSCSLTVDDLLIINAQGDVGDIMTVVDVSSRPDWWNMSYDEVVATSLKRDHCTVAVRFLPDMTDLLAAHTTWSSYNCMIRIFKAYVFEDPLVTGQNFTMQFSSYPGERMFPSMREACRSAVSASEASMGLLSPSATFRVCAPLVIEVSESVCVSAILDADPVVVACVLLTLSKCVACVCQRWLRCLAVHHITLHPVCAGSISSTDDFFQMNTGLVVMETTNDVFNMSLFDVVVPQNLLSWTRAVVSSTVSRTGPQWADMFGWYNSGTYSNMWIIVDYKKLSVGKPLLPHALTIAEQIPGEAWLPPRVQLQLWCLRRHFRRGWPAVTPLCALSAWFQRFFTPISRFAHGSELQCVCVCVCVCVLSLLVCTGLVAMNDLTDVLAYGYFPSYNRPYDKTVFELSGFGAMVCT